MWTTWEIRNHTVEFSEDGHKYIVDGLCLPSITQILSMKFGDKYKFIDKETLKRAAEKGTAVHDAIERYCKEGTESEYIEVKNFKFLQKQYGFKVLDNEVPVILFDKEDNPVATGRLDLVISNDDAIGLGDIKRTATLDKDYLAYQLNLYRIAYQQCYEKEVAFLKGVHLREDVRKYVNIPINEEMAWSLVDEYLERQEYEQKV